MGRNLDIESADDMLALQKGCFILNRWGHGPDYWYGLYIRGPYSMDLADDLWERGSLLASETDVDPGTIGSLSRIYDRGPDYVEAYATVLLLKRGSPDASAENITTRAIDIKPHLEAEIREASREIL